MRLKISLIRKRRCTHSSGNAKVDVKHEVKFSLITHKTASPRTHSSQKCSVLILTSSRSYVAHTGYATLPPASPHNFTASTPNVGSQIYHPPYTTTTSPPAVIFLHPLLPRGGKDPVEGRHPQIQCHFFKVF